MTAVTVAGAAVFFAVMGVLLKEFRWQGVPMFLCAAALVLLTAVRDLPAAWKTAFSDIELTGVAADACTAAVRVVGIGSVSSFAQDVCRDLSAEAPGRAVGVVGRLEILAVCLPFFRQIVSLGLSLLS